MRSPSNSKRNRQFGLTPLNFGALAGSWAQNNRSCGAGLVDIDGDSIEKTDHSALMADIALTPTTDNQFAVRGQQILVPRLAVLNQPLKKGVKEFSASKNACYLITGGLGQLGRLAARWLVSCGAEQLVLVSRRQPDEAGQELIGSLQGEGCQVIVHSADISKPDDVEELFDRITSECHPLAGVVHAAGVLDDGLIESQTWDRFQKVLSPKIDASALLHEHTRNLTLDLFVLYSSAASILGAPGQSNYAMGNAYLDGLAWNRRQAGLPCVSINWGPWSAGMADDERILKRMALQGISPLSAPEAHLAMEQTAWWRRRSGASDGCRLAKDANRPWRRHSADVSGTGWKSSKLGSRGIGTSQTTETDAGKTPGGIWSSQPFRNRCNRSWHWLTPRKPTVH